jgi:drug/metabolite transporter (DMT)-like permease
VASPLATGVFGLASATSWGAGDFSGGLATKRAPVFAVAAVSKFASFSTMLIFAWLWAEHVPAFHTLEWAAAAGVAGAVGLVALYQALAVGVMGIAAPVSAIIAAAIPVGFAAASEGLPTGWQFSGFGLALIAVWLISRPSLPAASSPRRDPRPIGHQSVGQHDPPAGGPVEATRGLRLATVAGIGFGGFYVFISRARTDAVFGPLAASQFITLLTVFAFACAAALRRRAAFGRVHLRAVPLMLLAGLLDAGGNAFFLLAEHAGRLDAAAVLASLYPLSTVLLARFLLDERLSLPQIAGVAAALVAIPLIAA